MGSHALEVSVGWDVPVMWRHHPTGFHHRTHSTRSSMHTSPPLTPGSSHSQGLDPQVLFLMLGSLCASIFILVTSFGIYLSWKETRTFSNPVPPCIPIVHPGNSIPSCCLFQIAAKNIQILQE